MMLVFNSIVIRSGEPLLDSAIRQLIERHSPTDAPGWAACWLLALEAVEGCEDYHCLTRTILN